MVQTLNGHDLKGMFAAGTGWLEKLVPDINALNVFPVPDGDCGTNMLFTLRASLAETTHVDGGVGPVAGAIARGALMGARGNSGVILSQILRGFAQELSDKNVMGAKELANALDEAARTAYLAMSKPAEGTILTVMRDAASAASSEANDAGSSSVSVMYAATAAARASVINTPNLLAVLKDAGVVDAGGHGLYTFLEGALLHLKGETDGRTPELLCQRVAVTGQAAVSHEEDFYGFCTQFMLKGHNLSVTELRKVLESHGESLIVVGDAKTIRVHIHTHDADAVKALASSYGELCDIDVRSMDEQHQDFLLTNRARVASLPAAVIAVVNGEGLTSVFADLGAAAIIPGGQTMNPATMDILRAVEEVSSNNIILLPNNKNIIPTALLARTLTKKNLKVIPTETVPQGISALVAFMPEADFETTAGEMAEAAAAVKTIEVTRATRATRLNDLEIAEGQFIGLLDDNLLAAGNLSEDVIIQLLARLEISGSNVVTLYFGEDASEDEAGRVSAAICRRYPGLDVGIVNGGQPSYHYIISVE